jgi:hypothetical protein
VENHADRIEIRGDHDTPHVVIIAGNGEDLFTSETYDSHANAERAAAREAKQRGVPVLDTTIES